MITEGPMAGCLMDGVLGTHFVDGLSSCRMMSWLSDPFASRFQ
jgi:hypothetical protein